MDEARYVALTGNDIPEELFELICELRDEVFVNAPYGTVKDNSTFLSYLRKNIDTTSVIYDRQEDCVIGYYQIYPISKTFTRNFIVNKASFEDLKIEDINIYDTNEPKSLYIDKLILRKDYRGKKLNDPYNPLLDQKSPFKILTEEMARALINIHKKGVEFSFVLSESCKDDVNFINSICGEYNYIKYNHETGAKSFVSNFDFSKFAKTTDPVIASKLINEFNLYSSMEK